MNWHLPFEQKFSDDRALEEMPRYQFVTNFYQGFGLSFIAVLSQDVPSVRFYPQSAQSLEDISAARAASDVAELIEQNNHIEQLLTSIGYFLWTELLALFPDGCYVAFAGDAYCEARNESMDDHWRVLHALPGDGQNRPSVGDSLVQVQERYNVLSNMQAETYEYGIPPIYADPQVLDFDALSNQVAEPAAHFPARSLT